MKTPEEKLKNSIGMQLQFYTHSGASLEDTVERIFNKASNYAQNEAKSTCSYILKALEDIANWNDKMDEEWDDPGHRAKHALNEVNQFKTP